MPLKDLARRNLIAMRLHLNKMPGNQLSRVTQKRLVTLCLLQQARIEELEQLAIKNAAAIRQDALDLGSWGRRWFNAKMIGDTLADTLRKLAFVAGEEKILTEPFFEEIEGIVVSWEGVDDVV